MANKSVCKIEGCDKNASQVGMCQKHYVRVKKYGDPHHVTARSDYVKHIGKTTIWINKVATQVTEKCIIWPFAVGKSGYGNMSIKGRYLNAHRAVCEKAHGKPKNGQEASHLCNVRLCCNPKHLIWETHKENECRKMMHGTSLRGEGIGNSKMIESDILDIRSRSISGQTDRQISEVYGVLPRRIWAIRSRKSWAWLD